MQRVNQSEKMVEIHQKDQVRRSYRFEHTMQDSRDTYDTHEYKKESRRNPLLCIGTTLSVMNVIHFFVINGIG